MEFLEFPRSLAAKSERYDRVNVTRTAMVFVAQ